MSDESNSPAPSARGLRYVQRLWCRCYLWIFILACGTVGIVLGFWGFLEYFRAAGDPRSFPDICYFVLHLFFVESGEVDGPVPWQLQVARLVAPLATAGALYKAGMVIFQEQVKMLRLRFTRDHVVVCGLGRKGLQLVEDFRADGYRVVVIESDDKNDQIRICRELGAIVVVGNAAEETYLRKVRADRAEHVIAVCGDDGVNVKIAVDCYRLAHDPRSDPGGMVRCHVQVVDLELCRLLREHHIFTETSDRFELKLFNTYENAARSVVSERPLDYKPITADSSRQVHLVVIGFGQMGQSLTLQAAKTAHYANGRRPRVTVIDRMADAKKRMFYNRFPRFNKVCDTEFIPADAEDSEVLTRVSQWVGDEDSLTTLAICLDSDSRCLLCALSYATRLGDHRVPILVRMSETTGLATLMRSGAFGSAAENPATRHARDFHPFGMIGQTCNQQLLLCEDLDLLARRIHENYVRRCEASEGYQPDESTRPWEKLSHDLQESNLQHADHILVKLRAIGCISSATPVGSPVEDEFDEKAEIDLMAEMEHARWCAERYLAGWTWAESPKCIEKKTNPHLVPWDQLDEATQSIDRDAVRDIPHLLSLIGERVYRL